MKNGLGSSTLQGNKSPNNKNVPGGSNSPQETVTAPIVCSTDADTLSTEEIQTSTVQSTPTGNSSQVKYVSILEPNISAKLPSKANNVQTTNSSSLPVQVQNKLDVGKIMQLNPVKVNLDSSLASCQGQGTMHGGVSDGHSAGENSQTTDDAVKIIPQVEMKQLKDTSVIDQTPVIQGGTRNEYRCDLCSASFNRYGNYTRHRMIHTVNTKDDYRYKCQECGRLFLQRCDMKRHMLIHTNEQPFRCNECGRGYIRRSDLVVHMRFHKKEKTFKCVYCSKNFYQSGDLNRHMRNIHLQTSMLTCGHCSRQFVKEATLIRHMQTRHRDIIIRTLKTKTTTSNTENDQEEDSYMLKPRLLVK
ncbi:zinc finger protein 792-like [Pecten maximus]|uniref:zinc finger protein 792-like n=1 Tax=Pecten maximus TaxID=6579 RepID=UPI001457F91E|nr:zinc finger protein 792-like [Pecten maximus]